MVSRPLTRRPFCSPWSKESSQLSRLLSSEIGFVRLQLPRTVIGLRDLDKVNRKGSAVPDAPGTLVTHGEGSEYQHEQELEGGDSTLVHDSEEVETRAGGKSPQTRQEQQGNQSERRSLKTGPARRHLRIKPKGRGVLLMQEQRAWLLK